MDLEAGTVSAAPLSFACPSVPNSRTPQRRGRGGNVLLPGWDGSCANSTSNAEVSLSSTGRQQALLRLDFWPFSQSKV